MPLRLLLAAWLGLLLTATEAFPQGTCGGGGKYRLQPSPQVLITPVPTPADLDAGQVEAGIVSVRIVPRGKASRDWELCIRTTDPSMGGGGKPSSDVEYWPPGGSAWQPASMLNQLIAWGSGNGNVDIRFRVRVDWTDVPGSYSSVLALTLAAR